MGFWPIQNVEFSGRMRLSAWRRIAIGTWRSVGDPSTYGVIELRVDPALAYIEALAKKHKLRITLTHFTGKVIAETLKRHPELNATLRFGALHQRQHVDIFFQVANDPTGQDLSGTIVRQVETKSIMQIADELEGLVQKIRTLGDKDTYQIKHSIFAKVPGWLAAWLLDLTGLVAYKLNLWAPWMGAPRDPFGSLMITNVGSLGISFGFAPLVPYSHCPAVLALGAVEDRAVVENGEIKPAKVLDLCATLDHRIIDGLHASKMAKSIKEIFQNPETFFGPV